MTLQGHIIQTGDESLEDQIIRLELSIMAHEMELQILTAKAEREGLL